MQTKTKPDITQTISEGVGSGGLRMQLLTQATGEIPQAIIRDVNRLTKNANVESETARVLACRIIASAVDANGNFVGHNPAVWNLGSSALAYTRKQGTTAYESTLNRLVRCCSLPLPLAESHIFSFTQLLLGSGIEINFTRLYWDLYNWECPERNIPLAWASAFCDLRTQSSTDE